LRLGSISRDAPVAAWRERVTLTPPGTRPHDPDRRSR
jgi:hypothetical protein